MSEFPVNIFQTPHRNWLETALTVVLSSGQRPQQELILLLLHLCFPIMRDYVKKAHMWCRLSGIWVPCSWKDIVYSWGMHEMHHSSARGCCSGSHLVGISPVDVQSFLASLIRSFVSSSRKFKVPFSILNQQVRNMCNA